MHGRSFSVDDPRQCAVAESKSGSVQIRATLNSRKVMSVQLVGHSDKLVINLLQLVNAKVHKFELARLSYEHLAVCWAWERNDFFVLGAVKDATSSALCHEIYCWPMDESRDDWLAFFESKRVRTMTVYEGALESGTELRKRRASLSSLPCITDFGIIDFGIIARNLNESLPQSPMIV